MNTLSTASIRCARPLAALLLLAVLSGCSMWQAREDSRPAARDRPLPGEEAPGQVIDPNAQRPKIAVRQIKSEDYEAGGYASMLVINRNQTVGLYGVRAAYHKTENFFVEANYAFASTAGFDEARKLLGDEKGADVDYSSFGLNLGYDLLPGDLYVSRNYTLPIMLYGVAGIGYASYEDDNFASYHVGAGVKLLPRDWLVIRLELGDHAWSRDGLDHNAEFSFGLSALF